MTLWWAIFILVGVAILLALFSWLTANAIVKGIVSFLEKLFTQRRSK
jgi:hypothetical protein